MRKGQVVLRGIIYNKLFLRYSPAILFNLPSFRLFAPVSILHATFFYRSQNLPQTKALYESYQSAMIYDHMRDRNDTSGNYGDMLTDVETTEVWYEYVQTTSQKRLRVGALFRYLTGDYAAKIHRPMWRWLYLHWRYSEAAPQWNNRAARQNHYLLLRYLLITRQFMNPHTHGFARYLSLLMTFYLT